VDERGLDDMDRRLLDALITKYQGGPVGLGTLAVVVGEEAGTLEDVYEPFLIQEGFLKRTARGREATPLAYEHLGLAVPASASASAGGGAAAAPAGGAAAAARAGQPELPLS
jgi:Holliday junction DNA helicase RuvB